MLASHTEIEYFFEVYQTRHISRAAIRLGVAQPTLTLSLQKLEEKLGVKLFHRTKQGVVPTEPGKLFFRKAHALLDCWKSIHQGLEKSVTEIHGRFKVGCHQSVGAYTLPKLMERISQNAPGLQLELFHDSSRKILERIVSYELDLAFVVNPVRHPDLVLKKMGSDRVLFWKKAGLKIIPKKILADANLMQIQDILAKTQMKEFKDWSLMSTPSLELIRTLTLAGQGVGILPERVAKADGADLVIYDERLPSFDDKIFMAYRREVLSSQAGGELIRLASFEL